MHNRWPHRLAVLLVCATFPLIWVGALVTSEEAGMAVPDWPTTYGYNMFAYPWTTWIMGPWDLFIEHGHRQLGAVVGLIAIALLIATMVSERRRWVKGLAALALVMVVAQGVLGGLRVVWDQGATLSLLGTEFGRVDGSSLAKIHGCFGPLFFAVCVALACVTSRWWCEADSSRSKISSGVLQNGAIILTALVYLQLVFGAQLRHVSPGASYTGFQAAVWGHVILAFILAGYAYFLAATALLQMKDYPLIRRPALTLAGLVTLQLGLGLGSWIAKYAVPPIFQNEWTVGWTNTSGTMLASAVLTSHVAIGSMILVTALTLALRANRLLQRPALGTSMTQTIVAEAQA